MADAQAARAELPRHLPRGDEDCVRHHDNAAGLVVQPLQVARHGRRQDDMHGIMPADGDEGRHEPGIPPDIPIGVVMQGERVAEAAARQDDQAGTGQAGTAVRRQIQRRVVAQSRAEQHEAGGERGHQLGQKAEPWEAVEVIAGNRRHRVEAFEHALRDDALSVHRRREKAHE